MKKGDKYQHFKGTVCEIVEPEAYMQFDSTRYVVYKEEGSEVVQIRPFTQFLEKVHVGNDTVKRYTAVEV